VEQMNPAVAVAIHIMTDMPIFCLMVRDKGPSRVAHVMVKSSEDAFIDSDGVCPLAEILNKVGVKPGEEWRLRRLSSNELFDWMKSGKLPLITRSIVAPAKAKARIILGQYGIPAR